ncbi:hypothetical protein B0H16DRAFT_1478719 [Mycena metata]|uniref:Uncharacterized protein n=1 Tax=Mycena metata TaxID=1033252 RepID=A0AAD7H7H0_9AGAR|nr:hypothetical protein B0H16DRAFT_1478719 [Mycena metata]
MTLWRFEAQFSRSSARIQGWTRNLDLSLGQRYITSSQAAIHRDVSGSSIDDPFSCIILPPLASHPNAASPQSDGGSMYRARRQMLARPHGAADVRARADTQRDIQVSVYQHAHGTRRPRAPATVHTLALPDPLLPVPDTPSPAGGYPARYSGVRATQRSGAHTTREIARPRCCPPTTPWATRHGKHAIEWDWTLGIARKAGKSLEREYVAVLRVEQVKAAWWGASLASATSPPKVFSTLLAHQASYMDTSSRLHIKKGQNHGGQKSRTAENGVDEDEESFIPMGNTSAEAPNQHKTFLPDKVLHSFYTPRDIQRVLTRQKVLYFHSESFGFQGLEKSGGSKITVSGNGVEEGRGKVPLCRFKCCKPPLPLPTLPLATAAVCHTAAVSRQPLPQPLIGIVRHCRRRTAAARGGVRLCPLSSVQSGPLWDGSVFNGHLNILTYT